MSKSLLPIGWLWNEFDMPSSSGPNGKPSKSERIWKRRQKELVRQSKQDIRSDEQEEKK